MFCAYFEIFYQNYHMVHRKLIEYMFKFLIEALFYSPLGRERSRRYHASNILTADMILLCTKEPVPNSWFSFPFLFPYSHEI
jgi:hypothetical protein